MREIFHSDLDALRTELSRMCELVAGAVNMASTALLEADLELAEQVIASDDLIDSLQAEIDERAVDLLARQSPVATDLRAVVAAMRMSSTLERMGDLARHVALTTRRRFPDHAVPSGVVPIFAGMGELAEAMTTKAATVIETRDLQLAASLAGDDERMDAYHRDVFGALFEPDWDQVVAATVDLTLIGRFYERIGDHAVSLAERVVFLVAGELDDLRVRKVSEA